MSAVRSVLQIKFATYTGFLFVCLWHGFTLRTWFMYISNVSPTAGPSSSRLRCCYSELQVAADLLKQYKAKFEGGALSVTWNYLRDSMGTYLSQTNPVLTHREGYGHLRDPRFQLDAFQVSIRLFPTQQVVAGDDFVFGGMASCTFRDGGLYLCCTYWKFLQVSPFSH